jgi:hypothetical protein
MAQYFESDPAGVLGAALSLHEAAMECTDMDVSDMFDGVDQFMRVVMAWATDFENWACHHVDFDELDEVWPYYLEDHFGAAVLQHHEGRLGDLSVVSAEKCYAVAMLLGLPLRKNSVWRNRPS